MDEMLLLASASPRRQELLRNARFVFRVHPAEIPEVRQNGEAPEEFARRLARDKARAVFQEVQPPPGTLVLGADTIVIVDEEVMGKPADAEDAERMLRRLSGRRHEVTTGVCLIGTDGASGAEAAFEDVSSATTQVFFAPLDEDEILNYIATGEPDDKAGAYAIQGAASRWVTHIEGDYFNVMGLPVSLVSRMLRERGERGGL